MKIYFCTLIILVFCVLLSFYLDVKVPEPIEEKLSLRVMEGCLKGLGHFMGVLITLGFTKPFSPFLKSIGSNVYRVCTSGKLWNPRDKSLKITDRLMNGVPVRVYEPLKSIQQSNRPVLIYIHGGGWTFLSIDNNDLLNQKISKEANIVVISVEYRLSPQNPYPAGLNDVANIVSYVFNNARDLGVHAGRIAVGGDSAGGNLAAAVELRPKMRGKIEMLLLLVPVLQAVNTKTIGFTENVEYLHKSMNDPGQVNFFLNYLNLDHSLCDAFQSNLHTSAAFKQGEYKFLFDQQKYLPDEYIRSKELKLKKTVIEDIGNETLFGVLKDKLTNPTVFPLMASDEELSYFPFTYVMAAGYDLIRDDAIMFAERLRHLNKDVELSHIADGFHNALVMFNGPLEVNVGVRTVNDIIRVLKKL
ncbi:neutral cholesterol ester hydrolase 1-like [Saccostrea echinata]|uniref:neutral cholesterol ester hydrolase 1-like n=1 Tax=Saccostrea echinata TaxID=191078 RepID=UPI002A838FC1|nr:neutral cholesterol ester hydrolase 1-like [Saccostrea echinata]